MQKNIFFVDSHGIIKNSLHQFSSKFHFFSIHSLITREQVLSVYPDAIGVKKTVRRSPEF